MKLNRPWFPNRRTASTVSGFLLMLSLISKTEAQQQTSPDTVFTISSRGLTSSAIVASPYPERREFLSLLPGVIELNGALHIRGGRQYDIGYAIDGAPVTNRFSGTSELHVIPEAIEELTLERSALGLDCGFATSGLVSTRMRKGGDELKVRATVLTDNIVKTGNEFLKTTSFGYRTSILTAEGTVPFAEGIRFFLAGENHYVRNKQAMFLDAFRYDSLRTDQGDGRPGSLLPGSITFSQNFIPNNWNERNTFNGTLAYDGLPVRLALSGIYQVKTFTEGAEWPTALVRIFNQWRVPRRQITSGFFTLAGSTTLEEMIDFDASITHYARSSRMFDPDFGEEWTLYSDSIANAQRGYTEFRSRWKPPLDYSVIEGFRIRHPSAPNPSYSKDDQSVWIFSAKAAVHPFDSWTITVGGSYERWTMRRFSVENEEDEVSVRMGRSNSAVVFESARTKIAPGLHRAYQSLRIRC
ncbi:MAG: hypothetical protein C4326_09905 [Ignavibacteria bacterium]